MEQTISDNNNISKESGSDQSNAVNVLDVFRHDEHLKQFVEQDFDSASYTSSVIKAANIGEALSRLNLALNQLDKELNSQVVAHHEELLSQVNNVKDLETMLQVITSGVDSLQLSVNRMIVDIGEPASVIYSRTLQLSRIQAACELLRKVIRFLYFSRKLKSHLQQGARELAKAAQCVLDLESLRKEGDLNGIAVVDAETRWIMKAGEDVMNNASRILIQGLESQNQTEVAAALQVFFNLGTLKTTVEGTITTLLERISKSMKASLMFNEETLSKGNLESSKTLLWTRLEKLMDTIHITCVQIWLIIRVLSKLKHPVLQTPLLAAVVKPNEQSVIISYWKELTQKISDCLDQAAKASPFIESTFVGDFPKLNRFFQELLKRLMTHYEIKYIKGSMSAEDQTLLINSVSLFRNAYLQRSFSRMFDSINKSFNMNSTPSSEEIINLVSIIANELETAHSSSDELTIAVAKNVSKAVKFFVTKVESSIGTDPTAYQITSDGTLSMTQQKNIKLFNVLFQLHANVTNVMNAMMTTPPLMSLGAVTEALNDLKKLGDQVLHPLYQKLAKYFEQTLLLMHREDFGGNDVAHSDGQACSGYLKQLQQQIMLLQNVLISKLANGTWLSHHNQLLSSRIVLFFVRHASLVRPLGEAGKLKLANDMAQLEFSIAPLFPANQLGYPYKMLRALRPFIFRETAQISSLSPTKCPELQVLPPSVILHHLFSRGPPSLQSPHTSRNWTVQQYSDWLDQHNEHEIWVLIKSTLDAYAAQVNLRGEKEFCPIYPIILSLGPSLLNRNM